MMNEKCANTVYVLIFAELNFREILSNPLSQNFRGILNSRFKKVTTIIPINAHYIEIFVAASVKMFFERESCIRGYHVYGAVWSPTSGERLYCERETRNLEDPYAVSVLKLDHEGVVGVGAQTKFREY